MSIVEENVIEMKVILEWVSIMCFSTLDKLSYSNSPEVTYKERDVKKCMDGS
jgi:hypothetical protein